MIQPSPAQPPLQRYSRRFRGLSSLAVALNLVAVVGQIVMAAAPLWKGGAVEAALLETGRQFLLSVPALLYVAALYFARRVFHRIADGQIFVANNAAGLRAMGWCVFAGGVWAMSFQGLVPYSDTQPLALTMSEVASGTTYVVLAALGMALVLIGRLMSTAVALKAENDTFV